MKTTFRILLLFALSVASGCKEQQEVERILTVDAGHLSNQEISIYDIFEDVELICLDSSHPISNTVYTGGSYLACSDSCFYVLDEKTFAVSAFDDMGHELFYSSKVGRGTGEFTMARYVHYNDEENLIEILNPMGRIYRYTPDSLNHVSTHIYNGLLATHQYYRQGNDYVLYSHSQEDKMRRWNLITEEMESFDYKPQEYLRHYVAPQYPFFEIDGQPCFFRNYDGLIYSVDIGNNRLKPYIAWDFGKYQCRLKDIPIYDNAREYYDFILGYSQGKVSPFFGMISSGDVLLANMVHKGRTHVVYYDLGNDKSFFFEMTKEGMKLLMDCASDKFMYKFVDGEHLHEYVNREILNEESKRAYDKVLQEDKSAMIKYTLRDV